MPHSNVDQALLVDRYSKWPIVVRLTSTDGPSLVAALEAQFTAFGYPESLVSDNSPFNSFFVSQYLEKNSVRQVTSSPYYAQSNGLAERMVQTVKRSLTKVLETGGNINECLLALRTTPIGDGLPAPSVLLQGRNLRHAVNAESRNLAPQWFPSRRVKHLLEHRQGRDAYYYNRTATATGPKVYSPGQIVRYRKQNDWLLAKVIAHAKAPRSYLLETTGGFKIRRNAKQMNITGEDIDWQHQSRKHPSPGPAMQPKDQEQSSGTNTDPVHTRATTTETPALRTTRSVRVVTTPAWYRD